MKYIDDKAIQKFVNRVESKKHYKRDAALVLRHLFEECGELSAALWNLEAMSTDGLKAGHKAVVGRELSDVVMLACHIAGILKIDMNKAIPDAMKAVANQYGVNHGTLE